MCSRFRTHAIYIAGGKGATLKPDNGKHSLSRYDPRTGRSTELPAPAGGLMQLVSPGAQDWVFLVKAK